MKTLRTLILVTFLALSVALNVSIFFGGMLFSLASGAVEAVTGLKSVVSRQAAELADVSTDLDAERRVNRELRQTSAEVSDNLINERRLSRELQGEVAELTDGLGNERRLSGELKKEVGGLTDNLVAERQATRRLRGQVGQLSDDLANQRRVVQSLQGQVDDAGKRLVTYRGKRVALSEAVTTTADGVSRRARNSASREVTATWGEALPWIGTAVIVGVTAMELKDLCDTIKDMNELKQSLSPELQPTEDEVTVCSMRVPTKEELWASTRSAPGAAWELAKEATPGLEDMKNIDWASYGSSVTSSLGTAASWTGGKITGGASWVGENATGAAKWTGSKAAGAARGIGGAATGAYCGLFTCEDPREVVGSTPEPAD